MKERVEPWRYWTVRPEAVCGNLGGNSEVSASSSEVQASTTRSRLMLCHSLGSDSKGRTTIVSACPAWVLLGQPQAQLCFDVMGPGAVSQ